MKEDAISILYFIIFLFLTEQEFRIIELSLVHL